MAAHAIEVALEIHRQPARMRNLRHMVLPDGMFDVIKIAAGDTATITKAVERYAAQPRVLQEAASIFLQQILSQAGSDPLRLLGLRKDATAQDIKEHKRWLQKWLHPDRNPNKWESVLFHRITNVSIDSEQKLEIAKPIPHNIANSTLLVQRRKMNRRSSWGIAKKRKRQISRWPWGKWSKRRSLALSVIILAAAVTSQQLSGQRVLSYAFVENLFK